MKLLQWLANPKSVDELPSIQNGTGAVTGDWFTQANG
jgi:hypothetical protein